MSSPQKRKGSAWELAISKYLVEKGWPHAERRLAGATLDKGDVYGVVGCVIEAKNEKRIDLAGYMKELEAEVKNAHADTGAVWVKKRGTTSVADCYVVMPAHMYVELLKDAGYQ